MLSNRRHIAVKCDQNLPQCKTHRILRIIKDIKVNSQALSEPARRIYGGIGRSEPGSTTRASDLTGGTKAIAGARTRRNKNRATKGTAPWWRTARPVAWPAEWRA